MPSITVCELIKSLENKTTSIVLLQTNRNDDFRTSSAT